ncbi:class I SAM-dependent methyltransferase [Pelosinus sp. UFO1]|uniref:class I SAM-dependent methyltransferase n=1 Tax=Pelosinus sp. UFO1 TaxID=484770 RepID=UPI00068BDFA2|nr:class I SAM-dependent methyltransferase [Pelosinus sp. UFO1]
MTIMEGERMYLLYSIVIIILFLIIWFAWKFTSRKKNVPCPSWLYRAVELENPFARSSQSKSIISGLDVEEGMTILDIGCGPGRISIPLAKAVGEQGKIILVDIQQEMLDIVKRKALKENMHNIIVVNIPMGEGRLKDYKADRAVLAAVLGEIPNRIIALKEIYNSLKPGGILAISETMFDPHYQRKQTILDLVKSIGFAEVGFTGNKLAYTIYLKR